MKKTFFKGVVATAVVAATLALSSVVAFASQTTWNFDSITASSTALSSDYDNNGLILASGTKVTESSKSYNGTTYSNRFQFSGSGSTSSKYLKFTTTAGGTVTIAAISGSNKDDTRTVTLDNGNGYTKVNTIDTVSGNYGGYTFDLNGAGTYYLYASDGVNVGCVILDLEDSGIVYDKSKFGTETTDTSIVVPDGEAVDSLTPASVTGKEEGTDLTIKTATTVGNFVINSGSNDSGITVTDNLFKLGGSKRAVAITVGANTIIKVNGAKNASSDEKEAARELRLDSGSIGGTKVNSISCAVGETYTFSTKIETAGTYYLYSASKAINFESIEVYNAVSAVAPSITLSNGEVSGDKVAFKAVISGAASDKVTVTGINVVTAKGYDAQGETTYSAISHDIKSIAKDGNDYAFIVTVDKATADTTSLEIQASVEYDNDGAVSTSYSNVVDYAAE